MNRHVYIQKCLLIVCGLALCLSVCGVAQASTIYVNTTDDEYLDGGGDCSLREAIVAANKDSAVDGCHAGTTTDNIILASGETYYLDIPPSATDDATTGDLNITGDLSIQGNGSVVDAGYHFNIFSVENKTNVTINNLTIQSGDRGIKTESATSLSLDGCTIQKNRYGGIWSGGELDIADSLITGNGDSEYWSYGDAIIYVGDTTRIRNSSIVKNDGKAIGDHVPATDYFDVIIENTTVDHNASGIYSACGSSCVGAKYWLYNVTVTNNTETGLYAFGPHPIYSSNSIVAYNGENCSGSDIMVMNNNALQNYDSESDCSVSWVVGSTGSINSADPLLDSTAHDNGGDTYTVSLKEGSPAIDGGTNCVDYDGNALITDQRGFDRSVDGDGDGTGVCDLGAYEYDPDIDGVDNDGDGISARIDCDDTDASIRPGATELYNEIDDDCDGEVDEGIYFKDTDGDDYGNPSDRVAAASLPTGYVEDDTDCDDTNPSINPGATETCNGLDDNCNTVRDDGLTTTFFYIDADSDGYGDPSYTTRITACSNPTGYVADNTDCDDSRSTVNPGYAEWCDGSDNDCDGLTDEEGTDMVKIYYDHDGDGWGNPSITKTVCYRTTVDDYVSYSYAKDCDDSNAFINPGSTEICNSKDDDCDGTVDDGLSFTTYYFDSDSDGYGDPAVSVSACARPTGYVVDNTDCDDTSKFIKPGSTEILNSKDDDCDGSVDEDVTSTTYYPDSDGDGYGNPEYPVSASSARTGLVTDNTDCNDADNSINPGATETCNAKDDDCNGTIDNVDSAHATTWFKDADHDGFGARLESTVACDQPSYYVPEPGDCNDADVNIAPYLPEICNSKDDDCDGTVDDGLSFTTYYFDSDGDGYGNAAVPAEACSAVAKWVSDNTDCGDANAAINPGATEICDGVDNDCDRARDEDCGGTDTVTDGDTSVADTSSDTPVDAGSDTGTGSDTVSVTGSTDTSAVTSGSDDLSVTSGSGADTVVSSPSTGTDTVAVSGGITSSGPDSTGSGSSTVSGSPVAVGAEPADVGIASPGDGDDSDGGSDVGGDLGGGQVVLEKEEAGSCSLHLSAGTLPSMTLWPIVLFGIMIVMGRRICIPKILREPF